MSHENDLLLMQEDNSQTRSPFSVIGPVWPRLQTDFRERLRYGVDLSGFNSSFAAYPPGDRHYVGYAQHMGVTNTIDWYAAACDAFIDKLKARDVYGVLDRVKLPMDWDFLCSVEEVISILDINPGLLDQHLTVLDLGSGWGRIGHVMMTLNPKLTYIACDIPESLILAQVHLGQKLPSVTHHPYAEAREVQTFDRNVLNDPGMWFCGTQHLDRFAEGTIDVFVNTFSFQEMTHAQVTEYFEVIDRVAKDGILYTQQRKQGDEMTRENYPYLSNWNQLYDREIIFSPVYFEAAFQVKAL